MPSRLHFTTYAQQGRFAEREADKIIFRLVILWHNNQLLCLIPVLKANYQVLV